MLYNLEDRKFIIKLSNNFSNDNKTDIPDHFSLAFAVLSRLFSLSQRSKKEIFFYVINIFDVISQRVAKKGHKIASGWTYKIFKRQNMKSK